MKIALTGSRDQVTPLQLRTVAPHLEAF